MADDEKAPTSRKRVADTQINKDNPEHDSPEQETGTFKRASEEVMATRRIVKVRRNQQPTVPSSNPFSGIKFVAPSDSTVETSDTVAELQPGGDINVSNEKSTCLSEKTDEGNGSGQDALLMTHKKEDANDKSEVIKDESALESNCADISGELIQPVETSEKVEDGRNESATEAKEVGCGESKKDAGKTAESETEARDGEAEENEGAEQNEARDGDQVSKEDPGRTAGATNGGSEEKKEADHNAPPSSSTPLFSFQKASSSQEGKPSTPLSSFQQLSSSQNAFTGLAGTGFSGSSFSFGSASKESSQFANSGPLFGLKSNSSPFPSFGFGTSHNGSLSSSTLGTSTEAPRSGKLSMPEVPVETGEENEKAVFTADAALYEYLEGGWKERGKGELKLNVSVSSDERARLVMRAKGNFRLILNASLYPDMSLKDMDKKGVTFACMNSIGEAQPALTTFALKFKDAGIREEFSAAVATHKGKKAHDALKTPENSPKATDD